MDTVNVVDLWGSNGFHAARGSIGHNCHKTIYQSSVLVLGSGALYSLVLGVSGGETKSFVNADRSAAHGRLSSCGPRVAL